MGIDVVAGEPHFVDHLAPVWAALPDALRGSFLVQPDLLPRAAALGLEATALPANPKRGVPDPRGDVALVASFGDQKAAQDLGFEELIRMEHGAGQSYGDSGASDQGSYAGGIEAERVGLFLTPNQHSTDRWQRAYPNASVAAVGCPKLDQLPARGPGPLTVAITFHWDCYLIPETEPALEFQAALPELARRFRLIGHAHPKGQWPAHMARLYQKLGIEFVASFEEVCRRADLLVFDNTSAGFEFAATGRPVVVMNARRYRRNVNHGLRFWDAAAVGVNVDRPAQLVAGVELALVDGDQERSRREAALDLVYAQRTDAAARAAAAIASWVSTRNVAVPA